MAPTICVGIDVSKLTLDIAVLKDGVKAFSTKIDNSETAIKEFLHTMRSDHKSTRDNTIYCAEHMGIYGKFLVEALVAKQVRLCLESPLQIRLSLGIQRNKSDVLDAIRIAEYAYKHHASLRLWEPPRPPVQKLKMLMTIRKRLIKMGAMLKNNKKVEAYFLAEPSRKEVDEFTQQTFAAIKADVEAIERRMNETINFDPQLHSLTQLITSVPYVGKIIAIEILVHTNEFKDISSPGKFCSYCGIAPFAQTSGTSLKKRPRVSHIANKDLKTVLHLAALGSTRPGKSPFKAYYARKVAEGKNKMSVLNAVRNKIVTLIFACVRDNKLYQESA
jgi:transposase